MMNKKIINKKKIVFLLWMSFFSSQRVLCSQWQPIPYVGLDMDPTKAVFMIFPRIDSGYAINAFDDLRNEVTLADFVFGEGLQLQDIFLASKVAGQGNTNAQSGSYLALIGSTAMLMGAVQECTRTYLGASYTTTLGGSDVLWTNEILLPIEAWQQKLSMLFRGNGLGTATTSGATDPSIFFESYSDVDSFVQKEILDPKGLTFNPLQSKVVIGAIRLLSALDFSNYSFKCVSRLQCGFVAHLISPQTPSVDLVWPIQAGFGATYLGGFGQIYLNFNKISNPFFVIDVEAAVPTNSLQRVPMLKGPSNKQVIAGTATFGNSNILTSSNLAGTQITKDFSLFDSKLPFYSDQTVLVHSHRGEMIEVKIGNMVDCGPVQIKVWYEYAYRGTDHHRLSNMAAPLAADNVYNFDSLAVHTKNIYNMICWKVMYEVDEVHFAFGTNYTVAGKTAPKYIVFSLEAEVAF